MSYYTLAGVSYAPAPHLTHGIVFQKAARKSTLNTGDTKVVNGVTYTFNENRRWARADKKSRSRRSSPGANKRPPNVPIPVLEDAPKVKGKSRRMTPPAAPKANTEEIARQARRSAPRAISAEGLKPKGKPAQVKPKGKAKEKKPASGVADMRQSKDTGSRSNEKPAMQQTKATFTPKEVELKIRQAYLKASDGEYVVRVRIAKLRQSLADVPREQFDEILNQMELAGKLTMMHLDDPQEIRPEDEQAAINIGGHMNHIVYMRDWKDEPKAEAKAEAKPKAIPGNTPPAKAEAKPKAKAEVKAKAKATRKEFVVPDGYKEAENDLGQKRLQRADGKVKFFGGEEEGVKATPLHQIIPIKHSASDEEINEIAEDLKAGHQYAVPVAVLDGEDNYKLVSGGAILEAARRAGLKRLNIHIIPEDSKRGIPEFSQEEFDRQMKAYKGEDQPQDAGDLQAQLAELQKQIAKLEAENKQLQANASAGAK